LIIIATLLMRSVIDVLNINLKRKAVGSDMIQTGIAVGGIGS